MKFACISRIFCFFFLQGTVKCYSTQLLKPVLWHSNGSTALKCNYSKSSKPSKHHVALSDDAGSDSDSDSDSDSETRHEHRVRFSILPLSFSIFLSLSVLAFSFFFSFSQSFSPFISWNFVLTFFKIYFLFCQCKLGRKRFLASQNAHVSQYSGRQQRRYHLI